MWGCGESRNGDVMYSASQKDNTGGGKGDLEEVVKESKRSTETRSEDNACCGN